MKKAANADIDLVDELLKNFEAESLRGRFNTAGIFTVPKEAKCLDSAQLTALENAFRQWVDQAGRADVRLSRRRILLIFLLIRYSGARLNEILTLNEQQHIDWQNSLLRLGKAENSGGGTGRDVPIPPRITEELQGLRHEPAAGSAGFLLQVDPGHVRRKFYERGKACGLAPELVNPNAVRRSRAIELLRSNMPLPAVQKLLGHSTPNLAAAYVDFSARDMQRVIHHFIDRENQRKTSARNTFFGRISAIRQGDIQSSVEVVTLGGDTVCTVITNDSLKRLGLQKNSFVSAEVKAPWVIIARGGEAPASSAENRFQGTVSRIIRGKITTEFVVRIADGTELCTVVTRESANRLGIGENEQAWVLFNAFAVILNVD
ncbi:MAG: TOBE domain-containing protein [Deltaproteobacteria bacterium]|nr:TOBE domain-containing protein [Deltaproteobacteria bacterium]